jgi:hypothetical protein
LKLCLIFCLHTIRLNGGKRLNRGKDSKEEKGSIEVKAI